jgi:predicted homoserine dehydrogenase-like protein
VAKDTIVRFDDVVLERDLDIVALRQEMERTAVGQAATAR